MGFSSQNIAIVQTIPDLPLEMWTAILKEAAKEKGALPKLQSICKLWEEIFNQHLRSDKFRNVNLSERNLHQFSIRENGAEIENLRFGLCPFKRQNNVSLRWNEGQYEPLPFGFNSTIQPFEFITSRLNDLKAVSKKLRSLTLDFSGLIPYRENETSRQFLYEDKYLDAVFPLPATLTRLTLKGFIWNQAFSTKLAEELKKNTRLQELVLAPAVTQKVCPEQMQFLNQVPPSLKLTIEVSQSKFEAIQNVLKTQALPALNQTNIQIINSK